MSMRILVFILTLVTTTGFALDSGDSFSLTVYAEAASSQKTRGLVESKFDGAYVSPEVRARENIALYNYEKKFGSSDFCKLNPEGCCAKALVEGKKNENGAKKKLSEHVKTCVKISRRHCELLGGEFKLGKLKKSVNRDNFPGVNLTYIGLQRRFSCQLDFAQSYKIFK